MVSGVSAVQGVLGPGTPITDREIRDALWDSYFDVDGTVSFLLGTCSAITSLQSADDRGPQRSNTRRKLPKLAQKVRLILFSVLRPLSMLYTSVRGLHRPRLSGWMFIARLRQATRSTQLLRPNLSHLCRLHRRHLSRWKYLRNLRLPRALPRTSWRPKWQPIERQSLPPLQLKLAAKHQHRMM